MAKEPEHQPKPPPKSPDGPPQPTHREPAEPVKGGSQKSQIVQYFKSQGKQPDDVVFSIGGLNLTMKDLDG